MACGRILHFDRAGSPLWFNGAIVRNKYENAGSNPVMNFTHYAKEGTWDFINSCLDRDVTPINTILKGTIDHIATLPALYRL